MIKAILFFAVNFLSIITIAQQLYFTESPEDYEGSTDPLIGFKREEIEGFTTSPSIIAGEEVSFKVSVLSAWDPQTNQISDKSCSMEIYRVAGLTLQYDELIEGGFTFSASFYPLRDINEDPIFPGNYSKKPWDYRWGCNHWATAITIQTQSNWKSGFYYAKIILADDPNKVGYVPFVVKPAVQSADILCPIVWNTYQAYNYWGGGSLYWWLGEFESPDIKSNGESYIRTVSFRRPFVDYPNSPTPTNQLGKVDRFERRLIVWAEENGYELDFCVDSDLNGNEFDILNYRMILFAGHSEYWSWNERNNIEFLYKGIGGNLAFLCANNSYWMVDYFPIDPENINPDSMTCEKDRNDYLWRQQKDGSGTMHEGRFIGVQFYNVNQFNLAQTVKKPDHWIFRGTGLNLNDQFGFGQINPIASGESDMKTDDFIVINGTNHEILARVATGNLPPPQEINPLYAEISYYEDEQTNSRVFASGGMGWGESLFGSNQQDAIKVETITRNIFDHFSLKKYIGNIYSTASNPLIWDSDIELDGLVTILPERWLQLSGVPNLINATVGSVLFVDGNLEVLGDVTLSGNGSFNLNPDGKLFLRENSTLTVDCYFVLEQGTNQIIFEPGSKLIIDNTTLEAGSVLSIEEDGILEIKPGSIISALGGAKIEINGSLISNGEYNNKIGFNFISPDYEYQNGIKINPGAAANISYSVIDNAYISIAINETNADINNCEISNCGRGIYLYRTNYTNEDSWLMNNIISGCSYYGISMYQSSPYVIGNELYDNGMAIFCDQYSSPYLGYADTYGNNSIHNNSIGLFANFSSNPFLGRTGCIAFGGNNSFVNQTSYHIEALNYCEILAENNWWDSFAGKFYSYNSNIDYDPYLLEQPFNNMNNMKNSPEELAFDNKFAQRGFDSKVATEEKELGFQNDWCIKWKLLYARNLIEVKKYKQAQKICKDVIEEYPDSSLTHYAVDLLWQASRRGDSDSLKGFFKKLSNKKAKKKLYASAEKILAGFERNLRIENLDRIISKYSGEQVLEAVMFDKFIYYFNFQ